jgi:hypothetical protein
MKFEDMTSVVVYTYQRESVFLVNMLCLFRSVLFSCYSLVSKYVFSMTIVIDLSSR